MSKHSDDVAWSTLSQFRVTCQGQEKVDAPLYANGNQQLPVQVSVIAHNAEGEAVRLSSQQLADIELINYETGEVLSGSLGTSASASVDSPFVYQWALGTEGTAAAHGSVDALSVEGDENAQTVMRFVTTHDVSTLKIAAKITSPAKVAFQTNTLDPSTGQFDSWIRLVGVSQPRYSVANFKLTREDEFDSGQTDVDMYYIEFKDQSLRIVRSQAISHGDEIHHYSWEKGGWGSKVHLAYLVGPQQQMRFPKNPQSGWEHLSPWFTVNKYSGKACVARISSRLPPNPGRFDIGHVRYFDQYGNSVALALKPATDGNTMSIGDSSWGLEGDTATT